LNFEVLIKEVDEKWKIIGVSQSNEMHKEKSLAFHSQMNRFDVNLDSSDEFW
jgi:hypothetical protein